MRPGSGGPEANGSTRLASTRAQLILSLRCLLARLLRTTDTFTRGKHLPFYFMESFMSKVIHFVCSLTECAGWFSCYFQLVYTRTGNN